MTTFQKIVKYVAIVLAIILAVGIFRGIFGILGIVGIVDSLFNSNAVAEDMKTYTVSEDISILEVEINAADFTVKQGENFLVESNLNER